MMQAKRTDRNRDIIGRSLRANRRSFQISKKEHISLSQQAELVEQIGDVRLLACEFSI